MGKLQPSSHPPDNPSPKSRYVSRGGDKLRGALDAFRLPVEGRVCLDIGASTGGFTDCLLKAGVQSVWAIDVGYGLLDYHLRQDPRVRVFERTNFRHFDTSLLTELPTLAVIDVSFISLEKILPKLREILPEGGEAITLVKPQFEGTPKEAPGGVVRNEQVRFAILARVRGKITEFGFRILNQTDSSVTGRKGNREVFLHLQK